MSRLRAPALALSVMLAVFLVFGALLAGSASAATPFHTSVAAISEEHDLQLVAEWYEQDGTEPPQGPAQGYRVYTLRSPRPLAIVYCGMIDTRPYDLEEPALQAQMCRPEGLTCSAPEPVPSCAWSDVEVITPWEGVLRAMPPASSYSLRIQPSDERFSSLEAAVGGKRVRLRWLPHPAAEQRIRAVHQTRTALIAILITERDRERPAHEEQAVYVLLDEIHAPGSMARQARLIKLARDQQEDPFFAFPYYRMAAEIAPLPAPALFDAMYAARCANRLDLGVRWYRRAIRDVPRAEADALAAQLAADPYLPQFRLALRRPWLSE